METTEYIRLLRKWLWLFVACALVFGLAGYLIRSRQPPLYRAHALLAVGGVLDTPNPNSTEIRTSIDLAHNYVVLATSYNVLEAVNRQLPVEVSIGDLQEQIQAELLENTSLLQISATDADPAIAALIANEVANQIILHSPTNLTPEQFSHVEMLNAEVDRLNTELQQTRDQRALTDQLINEAETSDDVERLMNQRNELSAQINQTVANLGQFSATVAELQQHSNSLDIVEEAHVSTQPVGSGTLMIAFVSACLGLVLAGGIVWLAEFLDDTLTTSDHVSHALALPYLGTIMRFGRSNDTYAQKLLTSEDTGSSSWEAYRILRTSLLFANDSQDRHTYVVTSPGPAEGKSVTAANLAVAIAASGLRVLLIDADLRRPCLHDIFGLSNDVGLSNLLTADPRHIIVSPGVKDQPSIWITPNRDSTDRLVCLHRTPFAGLQVMTSGPLPAEPSEILGSDAMRRWHQAYLRNDLTDVILFDTPPALSVSDCTVLTALTGASIIVVLRAGKTRHQAIRLKDRFEQLQLDVAGVVLNLASRSQAGGSEYGYYDYGRRRVRS